MSEINENATNTKDVIILGSGPAGLTAALYTARAFLSSLILTGMSLHGQAGSTDIIENYPGFPNGIGGSELGLLFQSQAERFGAEVVMDQAISVDLQKYPFIVKTYSSTYAAKSIIISTGATHKKLNVPGEKKFTGRGVSYCGTCDGWFFKDKDVIVVGGGDSALEEGIFLTRFAKSVTIIHRRDKLRAGAFLQKRAFANPKISFIWNSVVTEIIGDDSLQAAKLKDVITNEENIVSIDGVFIFIGNEPNRQLFEGQLELDEEGYIKVNRFMETSVSGVFAAGEIADPHFRQVITSAGMGAAAGIQATRYLEDLESDGS
ncbi:MAG: thioredoxin-disulfide reductase [Brevefilum fermentans]|jgi:thioredoxin reductase (NADPH)|uniref:Thioredoxin reductase n=1 Tax=Candidatus Brevifilum fermentans TaxID=1986204 RepID=A0A1Y6K3S0_9CHLR|nr:thioredoxin-disulfide reductase [Brevefilum fermentans]MDI9567096.1 thioredoxin-disulfide reductase [Chloroflexota bacterium]SMX54352.1 Thioredoxin reductase [Brevefilum fermentans]